MNDKKRDNLWEISKKVYKELDVLLSYFPKIVQKQDKETLLISTKQIPINIFKARNNSENAADLKYLKNASLASQTLSEKLTQTFNTEKNNIFYQTILHRLSEVKNQLTLETKKHTLNK